MSKKMMKRTAALSALIAISLSGTVMAAEPTVTIDTGVKTGTAGAAVEHTATDSLTVTGGNLTVWAAADDSSITLDGGKNLVITTTGSDAVISTAKDSKIVLNGETVTINGHVISNSYDQTAEKTIKNASVTLNSTNATINGVAKAYGLNTKLDLNAEDTLTINNVVGAKSEGTIVDISAKNKVLINNTTDTNPTVRAYGAGSKVIIDGGKELVINSHGNDGVKTGNDAEQASITLKADKVTIDGLVVGCGTDSTIEVDGNDVTVDGGAHSYKDSQISINGTEIVTLNGSIDTKDESKVAVTSDKAAVLNADIIGRHMSEVLIDGGASTTINGTVYGYAHQSGTRQTDQIDITILGDEITIDAQGKSRAVAAACDFYPNDKNDSVNIILGDDDTTKINIKNFTEAGLFMAYDGSRTTVNADELNIISKDAEFGIYAASGTGDILDDLDGDTSDNAGVFIGKDTVTTIEVADAAVIAMSESVIDIQGDLTATAENAIVARGGTMININADENGDSLGSTVVLNGDISFNYDYESSQTGVDADIVINLDGEGSAWNGNTKMTWDMGAHGSDAAFVDALTVSNLTVAVENGASWNPTAVTSDDAAAVTGGKYIALNNLVLNDGTVDLANMNGQTLEVDAVSGTGGTIAIAEVQKAADGSAVSQMAVGNIADDTKLTVYGSEAITDQLASGEIDMQDLANMVVTESVQNEEVSVVSQITTEESDVAGAYTATVADGKITSIKEAINEQNQAVGEAALTLKAHWRAHMNDMNKRLGDLRRSNGEHGVWTRIVGGEAEYRGAEAQYNQYQFGYDQQAGDWTIGAAFTYADGESSFGYGSTDDESTAFALYGSKLNNDGTYVDLIARYARLDSEVSDLRGNSGDYDTDGYSVSAEYGKRFDQKNGTWIEPQAELSYGTIDSATFALGNKTLRFGSMDSLIARLGVSVGRDVEKGNIYARASYLYDFDGETSNTYTQGISRTIKEDLGGGWWEVGVGMTIDLSNATYLYADVEKTFGGEIDTNWQWNLGVRYSF